MVIIPILYNLFKLLLNFIKINKKYLGKITDEDDFCCFVLVILDGYSKVKSEWLEKTVHI